MSTMFGRTRLVGLALLVVTFIAGAFSGAALERVLSADPVVAERARDGDGRRGRDDRRERSYMIDRIDMSADQRATVDAILDRRSDRMRAVWGEVRPRMEAITDSTLAEIKDVLTPEQRAEYERLLEERRARWEEERTSR